MKVIKDSLRFIATIGPVGVIPYNRLWAPILCAPLGFLGHSLSSFPTLLLTLFTPLLAILAAMVFYVRSYTTRDREEEIVLDRCIGAVIVTGLLPCYTIKFLLFSALLYVGILSLGEFLLAHYGEYFDIKKEIDLPTYLVLALAIITLMILSLIWWITH